MPFAKFTHVVLEICKLSVHPSSYLTLFCQKLEVMKNYLAFLPRCVAETGIRHLVGKKCFKIDSRSGFSISMYCEKCFPTLVLILSPLIGGAMSCAVNSDSVLQLQDSWCCSWRKSCRRKTLRSDFVHKICVQSSVKLTSCSPPFNHFRVLQTKDKIKNINI